VAALDAHRDLARALEHGERSDEAKQTSEAGHSAYEKSRKAYVIAATALVGTKLEAGRVEG
jgi:hypothetical protein